MHVTCMSAIRLLIMGINYDYHNVDKQVELHLLDVTLERSVYKDALEKANIARSHRRYNCAEHGVGVNNVPTDSIY